MGIMGNNVMLKLYFIVMKFQDYAHLEPTDGSTNSPLDFSRLERAQAAHEHNGRTEATSNMT